MRVVVVALVAYLLAPLAARGQFDVVSRGEDQEIKIDAEQISYDKQSDTVTAHGGVVITRGDTELRADDVRVNRTTNEAEASGNVSIGDPEGVVFADSMQLNLNDETGAMTGAAIRSRRLQYSLWGSQVEKGLGQSYHIRNGRFTTCNCETGRQSWSISGEDLRITVDGYGILKDGTFNVLDVPVLYLPRAVLPVQRDRQSGFLIPSFGASNRRGFQTLLPFYWAISKSQDATIGLDFETSARVGAALEYRYALSRESSGILSGSFFNEHLRGEAAGTAAQPTIPENRWSVLGDQRQATVGRGLMYADTLLTSDNLFFREIDTYAFDHARNVAFRTLPYTTTHLGVVQLWDRVGFKAEGTYYQDLTTPSSQQTLQRAPSVSLWSQVPLGRFLLGDVATEAVNYQRSNGLSGLRLDFQPALTVPLPIEQYGFGSIRVAGRETAYHLTDTTFSGSTPNLDLPRNNTRELVQVNGEAGTILDRVYEFHRFGLEKIKHTIEPEIEYLYVPSVEQSDLPLFDGVDRVDHRNLVTYGVVSRILGKAEPETLASDAPKSSATGASIRELGRLSLTQSFDISREILPVSTDRAADHFSDIDIAGRVNPSRALSMRFLANYDTSNNDVSSARLGVFVEDPRDLGSQRLGTRTSAGVSYRVLSNNLLQELDTNLVLRLTDWAGFIYSSRYNVAASRFLDSLYGLRLISTCDCWAIDIAVSNQTNPAETQARVQLTLLGLGSSARQQTRVAVMP